MEEAILHSTLFNKTKELRAKDRKTYTVSAQIDRIVVDRNLESGKYMRRYCLDKHQENIFRACGITTEKVDDFVKSM